MANDLEGRPRLGEVLVATGLLSPQQIDQLLAVARRRRCRLGEAIVAEGVLTQDQINWALAQHFGLAYIDVDHATLDHDLVRSIRPALLYQHRVVPLVRIQDSITVAMADPTDAEPLIEIGGHTGCEIETAIAAAQAILAALDSVFTPEERRLALAREPTDDEFAKMAAYPAPPRQRLGEILVNELLISPEQLQDALAQQKASGQRLGELLIQQGTLSEDQINWALARHLDLPYIDLDPEAIDSSLSDLLPLDYLQEHLAVPMMRIGNQLILAIADPLDHDAIARVAKASRCNVVVSIARRRRLADLLATAPRAARPTDGAEAGLEPIRIHPDDAAAQSEAAPYAAARELSAEAAQAFTETLQHALLPPDEKGKVYEAIQAIATAGEGGGPEARKAARPGAFAPLTPGGIKLALQLLQHVGHCQPPVLTDDDLTATHGRAGALIAPDRRFVCDRREYDRTIASHTRAHHLEPQQVNNAVMAARAFVASGGKAKTLLVAEGEKALAQALTKVIRLASTRERPIPQAAEPGLPSHEPPDRRALDPAAQRAIRRALAQNALPPPSRDKAVRAFRLIHHALGGTFDRERLKDLIRRGIFVGFSPQEIGLVEQIMRAHGYQMT